MNTTLHILHLFANTENQKVNQVATERYNNLMQELSEQGITDYVIHPGVYNPDNTKKAIQIGHKAIVQYAKDNNLNEIIIAEDDICFTAKGSYDYFIYKVPYNYQLFCGLIYAGEVNSDGRILNGMSGTHTLYCVHNSMYDFILNQPDDVHCDRHLGQYAHQFLYYVIDKFVCIQRGGYSFNLRQNMWYDIYLEGKSLYKG